MAGALILDFGGVISRTPFETHDLAEKALGLAPGSLRWRGPFDPGSDPLWRELQDGRISEREYWSRRASEVGRLVGEKWDRVETFVRRTRGADVAAIVRPEAIAAVEAAKEAGCKLAILSNELDLFYGADLRSRLPLLGRFDAVVDATYTGILKPERRAYELCLERLGAAASDCVFVDDQPRNVAGAAAVGLRAVCFDVREPAASFRRALDLLGVARSAKL
jgi:putative hydrolase of the HAD superfamily